MRCCMDNMRSDSYLLVSFFGATRPMSKLRYTGAINRALDHVGVPGAVVGVSRGGVVETQAFGIAHLESGLPVTQDTVFRVASITKPITATMIMSLVEEGMIDLDRAVGDYLPGIPLSDGPDSWQHAITMRHLLSHTAGIDCELGFNQAQFGNSDSALARAISLYNGLHQWAAPGTTMSYGNTGYWLAGRVAEVVSGLPYERLIRDRIARPLGLDRTVFTADEAIVRPVALGHQPVHPMSAQHKLIKSFGYPRARRASGGVISSAANLLTFANWHVGVALAGPAITRELRDEMRKPVARLRASNDESWGLGWDLESSTDGTSIIGHGGSFGGYQTQLTLVPDRKFAFVVLSNSSHGAKAIRSIERTILKIELDLELAQPEAADISPDDLAQFAGTWSQPLARYRVKPADGGLDVVIEALDRSGAVQESTPPILFEPLAGSDFIARSGPNKGTRADFVINPTTGKFDFLRVGLRVARRI